MKSKLYWIEGSWPGRLAIFPRPRGGDWLEEEVQSWKGQELNVVVSTLTSEENKELDLSREEQLCRDHGIRFISLPIPDRGIPSSGQDIRTLVQHLKHLLEQGQAVGIHCRQGIGRSSLLAASILVLAPQDVELAFAHIAQARGCPVPDTLEQRSWVEHFAKKHLAQVKKFGHRSVPS